MDKGIVFLSLIFSAFVAGWVSNIVQLINMDSILNSSLGIVKLVCVFIAPVGSVLGMIGWF